MNTTPPLCHGERVISIAPCAPLLRLRYAIRRHYEQSLLLLFAAFHTRYAAIANAADAHARCRHGFCHTPILRAISQCLLLIDYLTLLLSIAYVLLGFTSLSFNINGYVTCCHAAFTLFDAPC